MEDGILDIGRLFEEEYEFDDQDLIKKPYIELELMGERKKFWFYYKGKKFLYKKIAIHMTEAYGELIAEKIANILSIPCASYLLAKFDYVEKNNDDFKDSRGVITPNFLKKGEKLIPMAGIISQVLTNYISLDKERQKLYNVDDLMFEDAIHQLNNIEDLWPILDIYFKDYSNRTEIIQTLVQQLVKIYFFDIITLQGDRHAFNFGIISGPQGQVKIAPILDNSNMCNFTRPKSMNEYMNSIQSKKHQQSDKKWKLQRQVFNTLYHSTLRFSGNTEDSLEKGNREKKARQLDSLRNFLAKSDSETTDLLYSYIIRLQEYGIENILAECELENDHQFPSEFKQYVVSAMNMNLDNILQVVEETKNRRR